MLVRFLTGVGFLLLTGCGFHLKGEASLSPELSKITLIKTGDRIFDDTLIQQLEKSGSRLVEGYQTAVLQLTLDVPEAVTIAQSSSTGLSIQLLTVRLNYALKSASGQWLIQQKTLTQTKEFELDSNQILAKNKEKQQLYQQMKKNLVSILLYQLQRFEQ